MSGDFKKNIFLCLIYSKDLKYLLLKETKNNKLDGLLIDDINQGAPQPYISKIIFSELDLKISPPRWQIITSLQNLEKEWKIDVYITILDIMNFKKEGFHLVPVDNLTENCHPNLKWIVPLSLDFSVYGSIFNQILMK